MVASIEDFSQRGLSSCVLDKAFDSVRHRVIFISIIRVAQLLF